jgi:hypothetical protein
VIDERLDAFLETVSRYAESAPLPDFVEREFRDFLTCGVRAHGFARRRTRRLVSYSRGSRRACGVPSAAGGTAG